MRKKQNFAEKVLNCIKMYDEKIKNSHSVKEAMFKFKNVNPILCGFSFEEEAFQMDDEKNVKIEGRVIKNENSQPVLFDGFFLIRDDIPSYLIKKEELKDHMDNKDLAYFGFLNSYSSMFKACIYKEAFKLLENGWGYENISDDHIVLARICKNNKIIELTGEKNKANKNNEELFSFKIKLYGFDKETNPLLIGELSYEDKPSSLKELYNSLELHLGFLLDIEKESLVKKIEKNYENYTNYVSTLPSWKLIQEVDKFFCIKQIFKELNLLLYNYEHNNIFFDSIRFEKEPLEALYLKLENYKKKDQLNIPLKSIF